MDTIELIEKVGFSWKGRQHIRDPKQNFEFVETGFTSRSHFIFARYSVTNSALLIVCHMQLNQF
jgi:hypothetical protein